MRKIQGSRDGMPGMVEPSARSGILISSAAIAASTLPAERPPISATALSSPTRSRAAFSARAGSARVSRTTIRSKWPMTPPPALTSSAPMARPFSTSLALPCPRPFNGRNTPTLMTGSGVGVATGVGSGVGAGCGAEGFLQPTNNSSIATSRAMVKRLILFYIKTT